MSEKNEHSEFGTASIESSDVWFSEYHAPDVKFSFAVEPVAVEQTPYQQICFYRNDTFGTFFTLNGYVQATSRDEFVYHDMIVHPAMAVNPDVRRVLIIGGGDGGTARELARYPNIERIDMVEIDEAVIRLCKRHMPQTAAVFSNEPRLNLLIGDGVVFANSASDGEYDLILVDSTDPVGPGEGLFTSEFYTNCYRILSENGIMINQQEGAFYEQDIWEMKRAHRKVKSVFPVARVYGFNIPTYASGYWYFGFASKGLDPLADHQAERWEQFGLDTRYYNREIHQAAFALPNNVKKIIESEDEDE